MVIAATVMFLLPVALVAVFVFGMSWVRMSSDAVWFTRPRWPRVHAEENASRHATVGGERRNQFVDATTSRR